MDSSRSLKIVPASPSDADALMELQFAASEGDEFHRAIWGSNTAANRRAAANRLLEKWQSAPSTFHVLKCLDASTNQLMAICIWGEVPAQSRAEALEEDCMTHCNWLPDAQERKVARAYLVDGLHERWKVMRGAPHLHLTNLGTHPAARHKGAATALVRWGLELAEEHGVPAYCEVSDMSHRLYLKLGFREVSTIHSLLDGEPFSTCPVVVKYPEKEKEETAVS